MDLSTTAILQSLALASVASVVFTATDMYTTNMWMQAWLLRRPNPESRERGRIPRFLVHHFGVRPGLTLNGVLEFVLLVVLLLAAAVSIDFVIPPPSLPIWVGVLSGACGASPQFYRVVRTNLKVAKLYHSQS